MKQLLATRPLELVRNAGWLRHKLRRRLAERRRRVTYGRRLARGDFVGEVGASGPAPGLAVVMPIFRVSEDHLRAAIASVRTQSDREWLLIAVDDGSPDSHVRRVIEDAARDDPRIRAVQRADNGGISVATDQGVGVSERDYVAFLDHDDRLHPRALALVRAALSSSPATDWLFTDEDKLDRRGSHCQPSFKPAFSRHLLASWNYVTHLRVVRRSAILAVGGHRREYDGAQDWDLALRLERAGATFLHLPGVLYHWRATERSMARSATAKPNANAKARQSILEWARAARPEAEPTIQTLSNAASIFRLRFRHQATRAGEDRRLRAGECDAPFETLGAEELLRPDRCLETLLDGRSEMVAVLPEGGMNWSAMIRLSELLDFPRTGIAAGYWRWRGRRSCSGWRVDAAGLPDDPWSGLSVDDPGYLNLALLPGPRHLPPPAGWLARRTDLIEALRASDDVPDPWRLATGMARIGLEVVTSAHVPVTVSEPPPPPQGAPPAELFETEMTPDWGRDLGLLP